MKKNLFLVLLALATSLNIVKANTIFDYSFFPVPKWEIYTNMGNVFSVSADRQGKLAFCATDGGMYVVDLNSADVVNKFTTLNGLISNSLKSVFVDSLNKVWIGGNDGSITIYDINTGTFKYIYDIKNSTQTNKAINWFYQYKNYMFIATGYGIHKISITNLNFIDAPYQQLGNFSPNTIVNNITIANNIIAAGTPSGVAYANINSNLNNPYSWSNYSDFPGEINILSIESVNNQIYVGTNNGIKYYDGENWVQSTYFQNRYIAGLKVIGNNLYSIIDNWWIFYSPINNLSELHQFADTAVYISLASNNKGDVIGGTYKKGIVINHNNQYPRIYPNGPNNSAFNGLAEDDNGNIWGCSDDEASGMSKFDGTTWTNYTIDKYPDMGSTNRVTKLVYDKNTLWGFSWGGGLIKYKNGVFKNYNPSNSILPPTQQNSNYCVPLYGAYDLNGRFFIIFYQSVSELLYSYNPEDSSFTSYSRFLGMQNIDKIAIDAYNTKWMVGLVNSNGLYYYNNKYIDTSTSEDIRGQYTTSDFTGGVTSINDVVVDKNNQVWICTNNGIYIINNPYAIIQNPNVKPALEWMGVITGNLKIPFQDNCTCIAVDVLNNKWVGTQTNGLFHFSEDGTTLIEQFHTNNSLIASNNILTLMVSPISGKAYVGTPNGLSVFQTSSIKPVTDFDEIKCAPNPYIVPSNIQLQIDGLVENSSIKIISLRGEVMAEFDSPGGKVGFWNGLDKKGNVVPSGIYIVIGYNKDGSKVGKGKIAVINK